MAEQSSQGKAFVPGFDYDIFISFARVDDATLIPGETGWVESFHRALDVSLAQILGRPNLVRIWRDPELGGGHLIDSTIKNCLEKSAIVLALNSPGFNHPDCYCRQEITWFKESAERQPYGMAVGEQSRILNARIYNMPHTDWPEELKGTLGFELFDPAMDGPLPITHQTYRHRIYDLAKAVSASLEQFRKLAEIESAAAVSIPDTETKKADVFIATVADTLKERRSLIISELENKGVSVHKKIPPPYEADRHTLAVQQAMQESLVSLHLLDNLGGAEIENDEQNTYPRQQINIALEHAQAPLIWVPRELDIDAISDATQKSLLQNLANHHRDTPEFFNRDSPDRIPDLIINRLTELQRLQQQASVQEQIPRSVLLDIHRKDEPSVFDLMTYLSAQRVLPYLNPNEDDPGRNLEVLRERLQKVTALVIFFGNVSKDWVHARMTEAVKIIYEDNCPVRACAVYLAPPNQADAGQNFGPACNFVFDNRSGFDETSIEPLLQSLRVEV